MIKLNIICIGRTKEPHFLSLTEDYIKRLKRYTSIEITEIKDSNPLSEAKKIRKCLESRKGYTVALGEEGKLLNSRQFAKKIESIPQSLNFIIGGPDGLDSAFKSEANEILSLSPMTFPHEMALLFLSEQLYRAFSILNHSKYHRD